MLGKVQGQKFARSLVVLLDSGSTATWINKKCLPVGIQGYSVPQVTGSTLAGTFASSEQVCIEDMILPEHQPKQSLPKAAAKVFHADCRYDMIVGRDILRAFGIDIYFSTDTVVVNGISKPMRPFPTARDGMAEAHVLLQDFLNETDPVVNDEDSESSEDDVLAACHVGTPKTLR